MWTVKVSGIKMFSMMKQDAYLEAFAIYFVDVGRSARWDSRPMLVPPIRSER